VITTNVTISVSDFIKPCTYEAAYYVASNLRPDDYRECTEGHGLIPTIHIPLSISSGESVSFIVPDGRTAGIAGVNTNGAIWMLTTPAIHDFPITFAREAKRFVDSKADQLLWNIVDKRNTVHLKLLKFLGFEFLNEVQHGPNNLTFIEFRKCAHQLH